MTNRIHSKGAFRQDEMVAGAASIKPGYLVMQNAAGAAVVHDTEGGLAEAMFAMEDALQGNTVDTAYTNGNIMTLILPVKGSVVNVIIEAGQSISIGDKLMSRGNGKLVEHRDLDSANPLKDPEVIIAIAEEAVPNGVSDVLAAVRII